VTRVLTPQGDALYISGEQPPPSAECRPASPLPPPGAGVAPGRSCAGGCDPSGWRLPARAGFTDAARAEAESVDAQLVDLERLDADLRQTL
jgi:hypothetical protein